MQSNTLQGKVYDVTGNASYAPGKSYHGKPTAPATTPNNG